MKIVKYTLLFFLLFVHYDLNASESDFNSWLTEFKIVARNEGISNETINMIMNDAVYLPKVIEYDRYQPEFYEDTKTYINKRVNKNKVKKGINLYKKNKMLINNVEKIFSVEKELLLSLMGIETNFGTYLGKMDIVSSLATLSFDKRRREFFTKELLILLKLVDEKKVNPSDLYGSWAGAYGNFQFMPRTVKDYAIDYNKDSKIELKNIEDSFASAANYLNKIGWKPGQPCFYKIELDNKIPEKFLNTSAKKIKNKKKVSFFKKYIYSSNIEDINNDLIAGIITPDKDIIPDANNIAPAYIVFNNYELILKWNRSLRFALAVCTLKERFNNEL